MPVSSLTITGTPPRAPRPAHMRSRPRRPDARTARRRKRGQRVAGRAAMRGSSRARALHERRMPARSPAAHEHQRASSSRETAEGVDQQRDPLVHGQAADVDDLEAVGRAASVRAAAPARSEGRASAGSREPLLREALGEERLPRIVA